MRLLRAPFRCLDFIVLSVIVLMITQCKDPGMDGQKSLEDPDLIEADSFLLAYHSFDGKIGDWFESNTCCSWSATLSNTIKRAGTSSVRFELRKTDVLYDYQAQLGRAPSRNNEGWYGFSLYFPSTYVKDSVEESIVQWQSLPDFALGEDWRSPPVLLGVLNDSLILEIRTDSKQISVQGQTGFTRINLGPLEKEAWLDWVFHIKWAYNDSGMLEVWKNEEKILTRNNKPNSYNDFKFPYFKIGINKWDWATISNDITKRVVYADEVTIGKANAGYDKVKPGRKQ